MESIQCIKIGSYSGGMTRLWNAIVLKSRAVVVSYNNPKSQEHITQILTKIMITFNTGVFAQRH